MICNKLFVITTNQCQMKCPFCYTSFVKDFTDKTPIDSIDPKMVSDFVNKRGGFDLLIFHGGEPLLVPDTILEIMKNIESKDVHFTIQSNLAFKSLSKKQMEVICSIDAGYGTSYSVDRFLPTPQLEEYWIENVRYLNSMGIPNTIIVTITEDQVFKQSPVALKKYLDSIGYDYILIERPQFPLEEMRKNKEKYELLYAQIDRYMEECYKLFPRNKCNLYDQVHYSLWRHHVLYCTDCSKFTYTLYPDGKLKHGCPALEKINIQDPHRNTKCLQCDLFQFCLGDCECMNVVCTFPKRMFRTIAEDIKREQDEKVPDFDV